MNRNVCWRRAALFAAVWWGATLACVPIDGRVQLAVEGHGVIDDVRVVFRFIDYFGRYSIHVLVLGIVLSFPGRWREFGRYALTMGTAILASQSLKMLVGRARPGLDEGVAHFAPLFSGEASMNSFPSGDATAGMALAGLLAQWFPRTGWYFRGMAVVVGLARVLEARHFLSDVVFGLGLGCFVSWVFAAAPGERLRDG